MRTPTDHSRLLTIIIIPLLLYAIQQIGKGSFFAAGATGALIVLKALVEWSHHCHSVSPFQHAPLVRRVEQLRASCCLCQQTSALRSYQAAGRHIAICHSCHHCLERDRS